MSVGGSHHEHISRIQWVEDGTTTKKDNTRAEMVAFVEKGGRAYVRDARGAVAYLGVRVSYAGNKYVQTYADGIWSDNLLALPRF
jgi:hypothetical protein